MNFVFSLLQITGCHIILPIISLSLSTASPTRSRRRSIPCLLRLMSIAMESSSVELNGLSASNNALNCGNWTSCLSAFTISRTSPLNTQHPRPFVTT